MTSTKFHPGCIRFINFMGTVSKKVVGLWLLRFKCMLDEALVDEYDNLISLMTIEFSWVL